MFEVIREHQLNIMLILCGACAMLLYLVCNTRFISKRRKGILFLMESMALLLMVFDRFAYIYRGDPSTFAGVMVRISKFLVYFLTSGMVFGLTLYLTDHLLADVGLVKLPVRVRLSAALAALGMLLAVLAASTDLYYYFDENNVYHRGRGFVIAYIVPVLCPAIIATVVLQYRKKIRRVIFISLLIYIFVPVFCGILQIFTYGISIVNMSMAAVSLSLYVFTYLDINNTVERAHEIEIQNMHSEQQHMKKLFDQTATAFVSAVEIKDEYAKGCAVRTAEYARRIAEHAGMNEAECEEAYYAALLHDVGIIGIPDNVIKNEGDPQKWDRELMQQKPLIGKEILSSITEYPYLAIGAQYSHERYNGTGYPDGLSGEDIPKVARIVGVADAFVSMTTKKRFRDERPVFIAREALVKGAGTDYDPLFANCMIKIIDEDTSTDEEHDALETHLICGEYRENITPGIAIDSSITRITFECEHDKNSGAAFSEPAVILFDSYDRRVHDNEKSIEAYRYVEYAEIWFDENHITTAARKLVRTAVKNVLHSVSGAEKYEITMGRHNDHIKLKMKGPLFEKEIVLVKPISAKSAYLALTGEHCTLKNITVEQTGETVGEDDIQRIADDVSFTDRMESDIKNIQIDQTRSSHTEGCEISDKLHLAFHTMSLPGADLIWHCPYIVIFSSADGRVNGENYREYALVKLCGENEGSQDYSHNSIVMKKTPDFPGWEAWKEQNHRGMEVDIDIEKKKNRITIRTENLGISIENTTTITDSPDKVYAALTGDQIALTDIRVNG